MSKCLSFNEVNSFELETVAGGGCYKVLSLTKWGIEFEIWVGSCPMVSA
ncbi:MAG TPA: hypothetical protein VKE22_17570 [Haliangiales bacterium]|nr:hypothetical protein [Haliangiales bacterium]